ncbi:phage baseplate assembly protein V [Microbulbifer sp. THAF38]|uniref:phage baseplate assembly protein V n=1 Tax=Microbulbifer sp. THAF38 TaxID=2587856 RepID=UPI001267D0AB|nr:phage baseplate assembly protein V [Microbulbifer sp. THAF38]QFT56607.1 Phage-related baseplate assembly protein [Microbulbifer sp. THAF38]
MNSDLMTVFLQQLGEIQRRLDNIMRLGTVAEIDYNTACARVRLGENLTTWLRWFAPAAGSNDTEWRPPSIGEQVAVLSPSGELRSGVILPAIYSDKAPANGKDAELYRRTFSNGDLIEYQNGNALVKVTGKIIAEAENINLKAKSISLNSESLQLEGAKIKMKGNVGHTDGNLTSNGISLPNHTHKVKSVGSPTEKPQ